VPYPRLNGWGICCDRPKFLNTMDLATKSMRTLRCSKNVSGPTRSSKCPYTCFAVGWKGSTLQMSSSWVMRSTLFHDPLTLCRLTTVFSNAQMWSHATTLAAAISRGYIAPKRDPYLSYALLALGVSYVNINAFLLGRSTRTTNVLYVNQAKSTKGFHFSKNKNQGG